MPSMVFVTAGRGSFSGFQSLGNFVEVAAGLVTRGRGRVRVGVGVGVEEVGTGGGTGMTN